MAWPLRILAEYLDPMKRFKDQKIQDTVVFFGSARVDSRDRAEPARFAEYERLSNESDDATHSRVHSRACSPRSQRPA